jgi:hypothetical protein
VFAPGRKTEAIVLVTWSRLNAEANSANLRKLKGESTDQGNRE